MADTDPFNRVNVRLDPELGSQLAAFCTATHYNRTQAVNLLLTAALKVWGQVVEEKMKPVMQARAQMFSPIFKNPPEGSDDV